MNSNIFEACDQPFIVTNYIYTFDSWIPDLLLGVLNRENTRC
jgi:hypothetical protein